MIRILGVDDYPLMMAGVAHDGASGETLFRELQPESTLTDLRMPDMSGIDAVTLQSPDWLLDASDQAHAVVIALKRGILDL